MGAGHELELRNRNPVFNRTNRPNLWFPLYINPNDSTVALTKSVTHHEEALPRNSKDEDGCWTWSRKKVEENNHLLVGRQARTGAWRVFRKDYIPPDGATTKEKSLWLDKNLNHENGKEELGRLFEKTPFDFPKSTALVQKILALGTVPNRHDIVLDFFAGSGTTAHAVMAQNAVDGGDRRYVLVQLPEPLDSENKDQKVGAECCDKLGKPRSIAELTKERLRRAAAAVCDEYPLFKGDTGFRSFQLQTSNIRAWNPNPDDLEGTLHEHTEHLAAGRSEADVLYELLLKLGLDLSVPIETRQVEGKDVHAVGAGTLFACLAESISRDDVEALAQAIIDWHMELAPEGETTIVFRDSGFADDVAKSNLAAILVQAGFDDTRIRSL
jgi:adenine-specific DNA-methyltransferase